VSTTEAGRTRAALKWLNYWGDPSPMEDIAATAV
jgi:hypothetical protein